VTKYSAAQKEKWVLLMDNFTNCDVDKLREHESLHHIIPSSSSVKQRWPQKMNLPIWEDVPPSTTKLGVELPCQELSEMIYANFKDNANANRIAASQKAKKREKNRRQQVANNNNASPVSNSKILHQPPPRIHENVVATRSGDNLDRHQQLLEDENARETVIFSYCVDFGRAAGITMGCLQLNDSLNPVVNQSSSNSCVISNLYTGEENAVNFTNNCSDALSFLNSTDPITYKNETINVRRELMTDLEATHIFLDNGRSCPCCGDGENVETYELEQDGKTRTFYRTFPLTDRVGDHFPTSLGIAD